MTDSQVEIDAVRAALDDTITVSLRTAEWACDPLPSCPQYAHVNPDWLRSLIAEAKRVRALVIPPGQPDGD